VSKFDVSALGLAVLESKSVDGSIFAYRISLILSLLAIQLLAHLDKVFEPSFHPLVPFRISFDASNG